MARRRSSGEWVEIVEAWERSGESQRAFAAKRGVRLTTLQSRIYRRRRERSSSRLVEVRVSPAARDFGPAEIVLPNGVTVRVATGTEPTWATALIKALLA